MPKNEIILYLKNNVEIVDNFDLLTRADFYLTIRLLNSNYSGKDLIDLMLLSQDYKKCLMYLSEKHVSDTNQNQYYEELLTKNQLRAKRLFLFNLFDIDYQNSTEFLNIVRDYIKNTKKDVLKVKFKYNRDNWSTRYPIVKNFNL